MGSPSSAGGGGGNWPKSSSLNSNCKNILLNTSIENHFNNKQDIKDIICTLGRFPLQVVVVAVTEEGGGRDTLKHLCNG